MDDDFAALLGEDGPDFRRIIVVVVAKFLAPAILLWVEEEFFSQVSLHGPNQTCYSLT